jgi:hypothetical protein
VSQECSTGKWTCEYCGKRGSREDAFVAAFDWNLELEQFTEHDWLTSTDPDVTRELLFVTTEDPPSPSRRKLLPSSRKLRLFGCGCCRRIWHLLSADWAKECVLVAESYCEGFVGEAQLKAAFLKAPESLLGLGGWHVERVAEAAGAAGETRAVWALVAARDVSAPEGGMPNAELPQQMRRSHCPDRQDSDPLERAAQAALLRDVYGNPFRIPSFDPLWRTHDVVAIARLMYDSRDFSSTPILADALQDAGCEDSEILAPCQGEGAHVRGCWVVDLVLGNK